MKKHLIVFLGLLLPSLCAIGQINNNPREPIYPSDLRDEIVRKFTSIAFTQEQRKLIEGRTFNFKFDTEKSGQAVLLEVVGLNDSALITLFKNKAKSLTPFDLAARNFIPVRSKFSIKVFFQRAGSSEGWFGLTPEYDFFENDVEDFKEIKKSGARADFLLSGVGIQPLGTPMEHLTFGGGFRGELSGTSRKGFTFGGQMVLAQNNIQRNYPEFSSNRSAAVANSFLGGIFLGKRYNNFNYQFDLSLAEQDLTQRRSSVGRSDPSVERFVGWSIGASINLFQQLGKEVVPLNHDPLVGEIPDYPQLAAHKFNVNLGIRYIHYPVPSARGITAEIGIGYRLTYYGVSAYKLKD
ncbi:MAG: hypothetical protein MRZ79_12385 [Bacteroidia bacterium]|nr:hypothetical protein [Bacteroidia bacterium]